LKALIFDGQLRLEEVPRPEFTGQECLVRVLKAGICNTDIEITKGYFGFTGVLGHEFVGVVEAASSAGLVGKRVVGEINAGCGRCEYCHTGLQRHCPNRTVMGILKRDGAFRDYLTLPEENLHVVPEIISDEEAVFTEPLAAACEILDQVHVNGEHRVAVLGDGKLGLLITMVLSRTHCRQSLVGKHGPKMELLKDYPVERVHVESVDRLARQFDFVVEATGSPRGWEMALRLVKPRGTVVLKSTFHEQIAFNTAPIVVDEITIVGSRCGRFETALDLLEKRSIHPSRLLQHTLPLHRGLEAFELAQQSGVLKVVLQP
jgi:threonine dehydrogenase-like Zn-dependent dehydrogenase